MVLFAGLWGFLLVALFATADSQTQSLQNQPANLTAAFRLAGLDPLAAWVSLGQVHPLFLLACGLFAIGLGVRSVAGELEAGTLELTLVRPLRRSTYLAAHVALLVPGALAITGAYALGAVVADRAFDPPGDPLAPGPHGRRGADRDAGAGPRRGRAARLVLALGARASPRLGHRRGGGDVRRELPVPALGAAAAPRPALGLLVLLAGPTIQEGRVLVGDLVVLAAVAAGTISAAFWRFGRRDLAA